MNEIIFNVVARIMDVPPEVVTEESSSSNLSNWDSLRQMKLIMAIEEALGIEFDDSDIVEMNNVRSIIERVSQRSE